MPFAVHLHRVLRAPASRVFRAFLEPDALAKWLPPHGFVARVHELDAREGGTFRISFTNFGAMAGHSFGGTFLELDPDRRIRYVERFDDPGLGGELEVEVRLREVSSGTDLEVVQSGIPDAIPPDACQLGWHESLVQLAWLVEPEIPAGA